MYDIFACLGRRTDRAFQKSLSGVKKGKEPLTPNFEKPNLSKRKDYLICRYSGENNKNTIWK